MCSITIRDSPSTELISSTSERMSLAVCLISKGVETISPNGRMIATILLPFENLEELILYGNQIKNISALSKLCKLRVLKLEGNLIEDVEPLLNLKNLEKLSLGDNPVKNVQLLENLTGTDIDLE